MAKILIVDDRPINRQFLLTLLGYGSHRLFEAVDGAEALQLVRSEHPDLVITDILMPKIDGYELVRRMRADPTLTQPRVIFVTATYLEAEATALAHICGVKHFLLKPVEPQRLLDLVSIALAEPAPPANQLTPDASIEHLRLLTDKLHKHVTELEFLNSELDRRVADRTVELEAANKELEAFSYSVSHDLRAPLRSISGSSAILQEDFSAALPADAVCHLDRIRDNIQQMSQLIDDLLGFARTARQPLVMATVALEPMVRECLDEFSTEIEKRKIRLEVGKLPDCRADTALLKQVLRNLIGNAVKYTRRQPHPQIEIGCRPASGEQIIYVKDNGAGFDMAYVDKLFGVFQRLHRDEDFEGTGVGLATVQRIVNRHGGRVWAEGKVGEGATFHFTLAER